jgi:hypothetical protein
MSLKRKTFKQMMFRTAMGMLWLQIISFLFYFLFALVVTIIFGDENGDTTPYQQLIATLATLLLTDYLSYQRTWDLGDDYNTRLTLSHAVYRKYYGLLVGFIAMAPATICWLLNLLFYAIRGSSTGFGTITGYLLFAWDPYFQIIRSHVTKGSWLVNFFYIPVLFQLPIVCHFAFNNGMRGIRRQIRLKKRHYIPPKTIQ